MTITVTIDRAASMLEWAIKTIPRVIPVLKGSPGIGKSAIVKALATKYKLKLIELRLAQCDQTDLLGFPSVNTETNKADYVPMATFPLVDDPIPEGYTGWLLFLDEINGAEVPVQKASYKTLEGEVGNSKMHPNVVIIAAGNLDTDNALVEEMSSAIQTRLLHITARSDFDTWIKHAEPEGVDHRILAYLHFKPGSLNNFNPEKLGLDSTYACERSWMFVDRILKTGIPVDSPELLPLIAGCVGEGVAREFIGHLSIYDKLPTLQAIVNNPADAIVPFGAGEGYALAGSLAQKAIETNATQLITYMCRLGKEYQTVFMRMASTRDGKVLKTNSAYQKWMIENANVIF